MRRKKEKNVIAYNPITVEDVIAEGKELLDILYYSDLRFITDSAWYKMYKTENGIPYYNKANEQIRKAYGEIEEKEKDAIDKLREKIMSAKAEFATNTELQTLVKDVISLCVKKGYQGCAMMYLRTLGEMPNSPENTEFIHNAVKGVVSGYARRLIATGITYKDRAMAAIYSAQTGSYGEGVKSMPIQEYIDAYNTTKVTAFTKIMSIDTLNKKTTKHTRLTQENYDEFYRQAERRRKEIEGIRTPEEHTL